MNLRSKNMHRKEIISQYDTVQSRPRVIKTIPSLEEAMKNDEQPQVGMMYFRADPRSRSDKSTA